MNAYDAAATAGLLAQLEPDLSYLLDELEIPENVQANLAEREVRRIGVFAKVEATEEAFREWLRTDLGLTPAASTADRVVVAKLAEAWEAARQRAVTTRKIEAEARVTGQAREMLKGVHLSLRRACARAHGAVEDRRCPGRAYLEGRLEQLDDGEVEAESLAKVTTVSLEQESVTACAGAGVDVRKDGVLHVIKGKRTAPLPLGPEQYRAVMKVMGLHWEMIHLKGAGRAILKDYSPAVFERHAEYILGDDCYLIGEANPTMACSPTWDLLMKYEHEVRKLAMRKINEEGVTLAVAMRMARESVEHRTKFFVTPLAMPNSRVLAPRPAGEPRGAKRMAEDALVPYEGGPASSAGGGSAHPGGGGKGKPKGKGKGKDKKKTVAQLKSMGPKEAYRVLRSNPSQFGVRFRGADGKPRCHNFQMGICSAAGCGYAHTCVRCGADHAVIKCPELGLGGR